MKYQFMAEHRSAHRVELMARVLKVTRSGFYAWCKRGICRRKQAKSEFVEQLRQIQTEVQQRYGSPRLTRELARRGTRVGHNRVARLIAKHGLGARRKKPFRITTGSTKDQWIGENLLDRQFSVAAPNQVWVSDITYVFTAEGWLYLAIVLDLCLRQVVGWSMGTRIDAQLVLEALMLTLSRRRPRRGLMLHSDRRSQYASRSFRKATAQWGMQQSMSRKGNCWDNACAESFFKTLKVELIGSYIYATRREAKSAIFEYVEVFYNRKRLHSTLDYISPADYEQRMEYRLAS
jgi:putative transposase